jgi:hypothetical protein
MYSSEFIAAKVADLGLVTFYYFVFALVFAVLLNLLTRLYEKYSPADTTKSTLRLSVEIILNIFFVAVAFWVIRNIVERIPFPLEGLGGYRHSRLSAEAVSGIAALTLILFQTALNDKIRELNNRLFTGSGAAGGGGEGGGDVGTAITQWLSTNVVG